MSPPEDLRKMLEAGVKNKLVKKNLLKGYAHTALGLARGANPEDEIEPTNDELLEMSRTTAKTLPELSKKYLKKGLI